jgi:hypothetical protein
MERYIILWIVKYLCKFGLCSEGEYISHDAAYNICRFVEGGGILHWEMVVWMGCLVWN